MFPDRFKDTFIGSDGTRRELDIILRERIGAQLGHGDGPKFKADVASPDFPDQMVWKLIAPIGDRLLSLPELTPSRVVRKHQDFKEMGIPVAEQIFWNKSNSALLMSDFTQGGRISLVDFVQVNAWMIGNPRAGVRILKMKAPWFLTHLESILASALTYTSRSAQGGYSCDFDTFFALQDSTTQEVSVVAGDLGHGVVKKNAPPGNLFLVNRNAILERFGSKLQLLNQRVYDRLEQTALDVFSVGKIQK